MPSWKVRSLRVLGLEQDYDDQDLSSLEAEEQTLCRDLIIALENAENSMIAVCRSKAAQQKDHEENNPRRNSGKDLEVDFSEESEVRFFDAVLTANGAPRQSERTMRTKSFDGTSAHKAHFKRNLQESDSDSDSDSEEEWDDTCDEIADLMGRQRHSCLWSQAW